MPKNSHLNLARRLKRDEFYTCRSTVEDELRHYTDHFKGKIVLCNCDDDEYSEFFKYFQSRFDVLGLKKLIGVHYENKKGKPSYKLELYKDTNKDGIVNFKDKIIKTPIYGNDEYPAGDFRSKECIELLKEADIVVTNPPFSLWRKFLAQLMEYDKKFLIIGDSIHSSKKEVFPLLKDNKVWLGYNKKINILRYIPDPEWKSLDEYDERYIKNLNKFGNIRWFTNLKTAYKQKPLDMRGIHYTTEEYQKYDNYLGININRVSEIPCDYPYVMGVPISFIDKYCPEQFQILGMTDSGSLSGDLRTLQYVNPIMHRPNGTTSNGNVINVSGPCVKLENLRDTDIYYTADNCNYKLKHLYDRILIRNKNPEWSKYRYEKIINYYLPKEYVPALTGRGVMVYDQEIPNFAEDFFSITPKRIKRISGTDIYYEKDSGYKPDTLKDLDILDSAENSFKWSTTKTNIAPDYSLAGDFAPTFTGFIGFAVSKQL